MPLDVVVGRAMLQLPHTDASHNKFHRFKRKNNVLKHMSKKRQTNTSCHFTRKHHRAPNWDFGTSHLKLNAHMVKCYKCLYHGHQQLQCALAWCNACSTWGHTITNCHAPYASGGGNSKSTVQDSLTLRSLSENRKKCDEKAKAEVRSFSQAVTCSPMKSRWRRSLQPAALRLPPP